MEESLRFYTEDLGFAITKRWTPGGKIEGPWLDKEGPLEPERIENSRA
jgi:hypothetical protein